MTIGSTHSATDLRERELTTTRLIDAPRERVFEAFSDPARLARWWGPNGFTNEFHEFELRPGGTWRFLMRGPDGRSYRNESRFADVAPPKRVVVRHVTPPRFELTISFEERSGKTLVGWRQLFETAEECRRIAKFAGDANEQNLDRLTAEVLATTDVPTQVPRGEA